MGFLLFPDVTVLQVSKQSRDEVLFLGDVRADELSVVDDAIIVEEEIVEQLCELLLDFEALGVITELWLDSVLRLANPAHDLSEAFVSKRCNVLDLAVKVGSLDESRKG